MFGSVVAVNVWVKPGCEQAFIDATLANARKSVLEEGNVRFDFMQCQEDPCRFTLIEVYKTAEQAAAHKTTEHYLTWRETVTDMMARPREGIKQNAIFIPTSSL
eukprot:TRINITY_DN16682_c0_g1_i1.p2 TRINITY_DN16682_c0_g1~~TRINITY_DN16682_c0_g1_i1.p2  ORF type:complete len:120 (+),score=16.68 TRINITY_DN16682_c0_g1_i1:51-362(+)